MIIVKGRELLIPENERYIGTTYDDNSTVRTFRIPRFHEDGMDKAQLDFYLIFNYDNGYVPSPAGVVKSVSDDYIVLEWDVNEDITEHPGCLFAWVRGFDYTGTVRWSSFPGVFYVETSGTEPTDLSDLEQRISEEDKLIRLAKLYKTQPLSSATAAEMINRDRIYVYVGNEAGYIRGNWYFWDGSAWTSGGVYNAVAVQTDQSLSQENIAADAKATGTAINAEATARKNAISVESGARQSADNTLQSNINAEASTRAVSDQNLQAQISQIVAPSGEAPSAAEVQNARVGADGVTYSTLGEAIRANDLYLKNAINLDRNEIGNVTAPLAILPGVVAEGVYHFINKRISTGAAYQHMTYTLQGERYLYVTGYAYATSYGLWGFFDSNGNVISYDSSHATGTQEKDVLVEVPANAVSVLVNGHTGESYALALKTYARTIRETEEGVFSLDVLTGLEKVSGTLHEGVAWNVNGGTNASTVYEYLEVSLVGGETLLIQGRNHSYAYPLYMVYDSSNNLIYHAYISNTGSAAMDFVKMPPAARKVIVNGLVSHQVDHGAKVYIYNGETLKEKIDEIDKDIEESTWSNHIITGLTTIVPTSETIGKARHKNGSDASASGYRYHTYDVSGGGKYLVTGYHFANGYPLYLIYFKDGTLIESAVLGDTGHEVFQMEVDIPVMAETIVINGITGTANYCVPLLQKYESSGESLRDTLLNQKRRYLFIGDSYCEGYSHDGNNSGWATYCAEYMGLTADEYARSYYGGARFSANGSNNTFFARLVANPYTFDQFTDIVVMGGYNDNSYTEEQITTGISDFITKAKKFFPYAKVHVAFVAWNKAGNGEGAIDDWQSIHNRLISTVLPAYHKCVEYGASYLNNMEYWLNDSLMTDSDGYHPGEAGNRSLARALANALLTGSAPLPYNGSLRV